MDNTMKMKKNVYYVLMFLPLAVTLSALPFLPNQIPVHYGINHQVTRWGSKYETLIIPVTVVFLGIFMLVMAKYGSKKEQNGNNNENVLIITGIVSLLFFNVMTGYILYTSFNKIENLEEVSLNIYQLMCSFSGVFMVIVGNIMP